MVLSPDNYPLRLEIYVRNSFGACCVIHFLPPSPFTNLTRRVIIHLFLQGRCNREKPPCKYFHPPQHLKDQLLINGRNHLALKNALMQQMGMAPNGQPIISSQLQPMVSCFTPAAFLPQCATNYRRCPFEECAPHTWARLNARLSAVDDQTFAQFRI